MVSSDRWRGHVAACSLFVTKTVRVKLLPFDNKSEVQVVLDLPRGTSLEDTERTLFAAADRLKDLPELTSIEAFAGTAAPFNFNGLVRHYYLRDKPEQGDLVVNLAPKAERSRASHTIALDIRNRLKSLPVPERTAVEVVEVPPGPPVLATLLAEIYGPDAASRRELAAKVREAFGAVDFVVDVDDGYGTRAPAPSLLDRSGSARISRRRGAGCLRHHRRHHGRREGRLLAAGRRLQAHRYHGRPTALGQDTRRAHLVDAAAGRWHGAPGCQRGARRRRAPRARDIVLSDLPPQWTLCRDGVGRGGGAASRRHSMACWRSRIRSAPCSGVREVP